MGKDRKKRKKKASKPQKDQKDSEEQIQTEDCPFEVENGEDITKQQSHSCEKVKNYTVEDYLQKIEDFMDSFDYELAQKFCDRALEVDSNHIELLETAGAVFLETGELEKARKCLEHATELSPEKGHTKYMYLGQILQGQDAVQAFTKGIDLMVQTYSNNKDTASQDVVNPLEISTAYCSLAELYLTDQCFDSDAEKKCFQFCEKAIEYDPSNPDGYQAMANCLLSQDKQKEAHTVLNKGLDLWLDKDEEIQQAVMPSYESRLTTSKLLLELEDFEMAEKVLQTLLEENDEDPQVWYLLGWMYHLAQQDDESKKICLEKAQKIMIKSNLQDEDLLKHISELLAETTCNDNEAMEEDAEGQDMET